MSRYEQQRADAARLARMQATDDRLWHGARPRMAPARTLQGPTGRTVDHDVYVLSPENFERAEQPMRHAKGDCLLAPGRDG